MHVYYSNASRVPNYCQITILLVVDSLSSQDYLMMTHCLHVAGNLPIKTLVARQLPTIIYVGLLQLAAINYS